MLRSEAQYAYIPLKYFELPAYYSNTETCAKSLVSLNTCSVERNSVSLCYCDAVHCTVNLIKQNDSYISSGWFMSYTRWIVHRFRGEINTVLYVYLLMIAIRFSTVSRAMLRSNMQSAKSRKIIISKPDTDVY